MEYGTASAMFDMVCMMEAEPVVDVEMLMVGRREILVLPLILILFYYKVAMEDDIVVFTKT